MKMNQKLRPGFTLVELLVVIVIIAALAGLTAPMVMRQRKKADQTEATNNARQVGMALFEFETEYGSFPDRDTATAVAEATGSNLNMSGDSANDYFRQLIAAGIAQAETMFFAKAPYTRKPDDIMNGAKALAAGENGFGYIMNGNIGFGIGGTPSRPIIATPLLNAATDGTFDPDPFDGKAVVLRLDNSVRSLQIRKTDKKVSLGGGQTLLQTGENTVWGSDTSPRLRAPLRRGGGSGSGGISDGGGAASGLED